MAARDDLETVEGQSPDLREELLERLRTVVPETIADGKLDLERLAALAGEAVETSPERYGLNWPGKREAIAMLQAPSRATLVPDCDESVNFDEAGHVFVEGENLEVLKLLYRSYFGRVKLIYIDPPYNLDGDFIYNDNFSDPLGAYLLATGQITESGDQTTSKVETAGRKHSRWLSMMYPRLSLARQLLSDAGVLMVSIDDTEVTALRQLCNEIFGEENFVAQMIWEGAGKNRASQIGVNHEYVLVYARSKIDQPADWTNAKDDVEPVLREVARLKKLYGEDFQSASKDLAGWYRANKAKPAFAHRRFRYIDKRGAYKEDDPTAPGGRKFDLVHPATKKVIPLRGNRGWAFDQAEFDRLVQEERISFITDTTIMVRRYLHETDRVTPQSVFYQPARSASERLNRAMGGPVFDYPKDEIVLAKLIEMIGAGTETGGIMLDFFAGSGAFAHAVVIQNQKDGGNRQYIAVQFPEKIKPSHPAFEYLQSLGINDIAGVTRKRLRAINNGGFRAFRLSASTIRRWSGVAKQDAESYEIQLEAFTDSLEPGWKTENVIWEVALREGLGLTAIVEKIGEGAPVFHKVLDEEREKAFTICLDDNLTLDSVKAVGLSKEDLFVCRATALNDTLAANVALQCRLKVL